MSQGNQILERIAEIQRTIMLAGGYPAGGIQMAEPYLPSDISSAVAPFFLNAVRGGDTNFMATGGLQFVDTKYEMTLAVQRKEANANMRDVNKETMRWRDVVFSTFAQHIRLSNSSGVQDLTFILDASIKRWDVIELVYGKTSYIALSFDLQVREAFPLTITQ